MIDKKNNTVHVWVDRSINYDENQLRCFLGIEEFLYANELRNKKHRRDFIVAHALKRIRIAQILNTNNPNTLCFRRRPSGKPYLFGDELYFNLSHSHGVTALVVSLSCECGVDIERHRNFNKLISLSSKTMTLFERKIIEQSQSPQKTFLQKWVIKEAFAKLSGIGLREPFKKLCTSKELIKSDKCFGKLRNAAMFWKTGFGYSLAACGIGNVKFILEDSINDLLVPGSNLRNTLNINDNIYIH